MNKFKTAIDLAPQKAITNVDKRLKSFFNDCEDNEDKLIYEELSKSAERYKNFEEIASGGMKTIFAVDDVHGDRKLAMALLHEGSEAANIEPFLREARLTARLDHPNIIKIHDIGLNQDQKPYFTMDLKSGRTLSHFIKEEHDLRDSLVIFLKVCDAISYAHSNGVIHLDLKPENIQIGDFGEVLVCDWGLGKIIDDDKFSSEHSTGSFILNNATMHGHIKGTPGFMAPEQINGEKKTSATDIYSLGAMLYNILSKKSPFRGSVKTILDKTVNTPPVKPGLIAPDLKIPESLEAVVMKAMEKNPQNRYKDVKELSSDIRAYLSGFATQAENAGFLKTLNLLIKRNKTLFAVISLASIIIIISTLLFIGEIQKEKNNALSERDRANELSKAEKTAREKAELSSSLLTKEKAELKLLNERYAEDLTLQSIFVAENINHWDVYDEKIYLKTLENLDKATKRDPDNHLAWAHKAFLLFIMQHYNEALKAFKNSRNISYFEPILIKAVELNKEGETVSVNTLCTLIELIDSLNIQRPQRKALTDKIISYDVNVHSRKYKEKLLLTIALIKVWNPSWKGSASYDPATRKMVLSGNELKALRTTKNHLTNKENILRLLNPVSLTFIDTSLTDLFHLTDMSLQELDIRGTKISSLKDLHKFKQLSSLILRPDQIRKFNKYDIPKWVNLIYKD